MDDRLARDVEDLAVRIRAIEGLDTPYTRALVGQVATLQAQVTKINEEGALRTRGELERMHDQIAATRAAIADLEGDLESMRKEGQSLRRAVLIAVLAAALSLAGSLILQALRPG